MKARRQRIVIAGGGVAALEATLALRELLGVRAELTLLCPEREFVYRPVSVAEPFGRGQARVYSLDELAAQLGTSLVHDRLARVLPEEQIILTAAEDRIGYDVLVVATGAIPQASLPGALTFRGPGDVEPLRAVLDGLGATRRPSLAVTLPSERMWTLPAYELALMSADYLREHGAEAEVWLVTPEEEPLSLFGPAAAQALEPLMSARGVLLRTSSRPALVRDRALVLAGAGTLYVDQVIALPVLVGPALAGLPHDANGFIPTDRHGRVIGQARVYAAGDVTSFPLKQGGLATQQADAAAEMIASELGGAVKPRPFVPVLRGLLMTGGAPLYLRAEPQRLPREATVAIEATPLHRSSRESSAAAGEPLWWPPAKIAGRYLAPFLAVAHPQPLHAATLTDHAPMSHRAAEAEEFDDALELALLLAECDARWGDYAAALNALDAAEALRGVLPPEYEAKRRAWRAERQAG